MYLVCKQWWPDVHVQRPLLGFTDVPCLASNANVDWKTCPKTGAMQHDTSFLCSCFNNQISVVCWWCVSSASRQHACKTNVASHRHLHVSLEILDLCRAETWCLYAHIMHRDLIYMCVTTYVSTACTFTCVIKWSLLLNIACWHCSDGYITRDVQTKQHSILISCVANRFLKPYLQRTERLWSCWGLTTYQSTYD